jgi:hypothetical protein
METFATIFVVVLVTALVVSWIGFLRSGSKREHYDDSSETWIPPGDLGSTGFSHHDHSKHDSSHHGGSHHGGTDGVGHHGGDFGGGHH